MDLHTFIRLAQQYSNLGWAVTEQFQRVADGTPLEELNGNALNMIAEVLDDLADADVEGAAELAEEIRADDTDRDEFGL